MATGYRDFKQNSGMGCLGYHPFTNGHGVYHRFRPVGFSLVGSRSVIGVGDQYSDGIGRSFDGCSLGIQYPSYACDRNGLRSFNRIITSPQKERQSFRIGSGRKFVKY